MVEKYARSANGLKNGKETASHLINNSRKAMAEDSQRHIVIKNQKDW